MGIEALVARLEAEAEREADALLAEARDRAATIRREAGREARDREERWRDRREGELRSESEGRVAEARRRARRQVLEAREELLADVRLEARRRLEGDRALEAYRVQASTRLSAALAYLGERDAVVRCRPGLSADLRPAADEDREGAGRGGGVPALEVEDDPGAPVGLVVRAADGSIVVDDTLAERLRRAWDDLAVEVVAAAGPGRAGEDRPEPGGERSPAGGPEGGGP